MGKNRKVDGFFRQKKTDPPNPAWWNLGINTFHRPRVPITRKQLQSTIFSRLIEIPVIAFAWFLGKIHRKLEEYFMRGIMKRWKFHPITPLYAVDSTLIAQNEKLITVDRTLRVQNRVIDRMTLDQLIDTFPFIAIGPCFCRRFIKHCGSPLDTCLTIGWAQDVSGDLESYSNYSRLSREDLEEWLDRTDRYALVKMMLSYPNKDNIYHICSCCDCCCIGFRQFRLFATPIITETQLVARVEPEKCIGCFKCINERCRFRAILKAHPDGTVVDPLEEDKSMISLKAYSYSESRRQWGLRIRQDPPTWEEMKQKHPRPWKARVVPNRCFGCGLCASPKYGCPQGAIKLVFRQSE